MVFYAIWYNLIQVQSLCFHITANINQQTAKVSSPKLKQRNKCHMKANAHITIFVAVVVVFHLRGQTTSSWHGNFQMR